MRSLVISGAGFIGSHVARLCLTFGYEVVGFVDLSGGFADQIPSNAHFIQGSVVDAQLVEALFDQHSFDNAYHLPAYAVEGIFHAKAHEILGTGTPTGLEEGIARMAAWACKVGARQGKPFEAIEAKEKSPGIWSRR